MRRFLASNSLAILSLIAIKNSQQESRSRGTGGPGSPIVIWSRGPWLALAGLACRDFPRYIPSLLYGCLLYRGYTRLLSLGMAVCDYASLVTLIQPIQNATYFGKNVPKIIFAIMGGSKHFSDLFRPQFSEHVAQFQHSRAPSRKVGPPFKLTFFLDWVLHEL
jgi:hypothetical protein